MKPIKLIGFAVMAITLALPGSAFAERDRQSRGAEGRARARNNEAGEQARNGAAPSQRTRAEAPRAVSGYQGYQGPGRAVVNGRGAAAPLQRREYAVPRVAPYNSRAYGTPRAYGAPHAYSYGQAYSHGHAYVGVPVVRYARPYYNFRPRSFIGFGIYLGYAVPYPVAYGYPAYAYGYPYGVRSGYVRPPLGSYGGMSFDIAPDNAAVLVDGQYVGFARDFSPWYQPLTLTPGRHRIELQAPGTAPLVFDVEIMPGQVLPYRGTLQPY